jgi:hypothetical protein
MGVIQASLEALATSPALASGDMSTFYLQAKKVLSSFPDADIILADATGQLHAIVEIARGEGTELSVRFNRRAE